MSIEINSGEVTVMNRRIEGTFKDYTNLVNNIEDLKAEGYQASQLLVITRSNLEASLTEKTGVRVVITSDESLWDKIVSFFTVSLDDNEEAKTVDEEEVFEDYGIDEDTYERFVQALDDDEYLLLLDTAPPADSTQHADFMVRDGIIKEEIENPKKVEPDWTDSDDNPGDLSAHSLAAEAAGGKKIDPATEGKNEELHPETDVVMDEIQHDEIEYPDVDKVSTDPFGGETKND